MPARGSPPSLENQTLPYGSVPPARGQARRKLPCFPPGRAGRAASVPTCPTAPMLFVQAREDETIELRVRLPRLAGHDPAITHRLVLGDVRGARGLDLPAAVFVRGDAPPRYQTGGGQDLHPMADREDPLAPRVERADQIEHSWVVAQVLRRPAPDDEDRLVVVHSRVREGDVGVGPVARALDVGIPPGFEIVDDEMQAAPAGRRDDGTITSLEQPVPGVQALVALAGVPGDNQD